MNEWHQAEIHAQRAHKFYQQGRWDQALSELRLALAMDPTQCDWHFGMGLTLEALHRYGEAISSFEHVLRLRGEDVDAMLHLALDLIRSDQCRRAIKLLRRVAEIDPDCEPAFCTRILAHARLGEHEEAEEMFYRARQLVDDCPRCYDALAQSLAMRQDYDRATWCWQEALRLDPCYPDVHKNLAHVHWRRGQLERARECFLEQIKEDRCDVDALLALGNLLAEMGRQPEAAEKLRRALEVCPTCAPAHLHLGELAFLSGRLDAAATELEMADRLDPQLTGVHLCLAQVASRRGDLDKVRFHLRCELDKRGHKPAQVIELARLLIEARMPQPAVGLLTPIIEQDAPGRRLEPPRLAAALVLRGIARMLLGDIDRGARDCRRSLRHQPDDPWAMQNLALGYLNQGRVGRASHYLRKAMRRQPDNPHLRRMARRLHGARVRAVAASLRRRLLTRWLPQLPIRGGEPTFADAT